MTSKDDERLAGKYPEFARMSLNPGIGADALWEVASAMLATNTEDRLPTQLRHGSKLMPLGRYLKKSLSTKLGQTDEVRESLSDQALSHLYEELSLVRSAAWAADTSVREVFREVNAPYAQALEGRLKLKRRSL
jgi:hypothetical protein